MKKLYRTNCLIWLVASIVLLTNIQIVSGQTGKKQAVPIPENINKIFQASCARCHSNTGGLMSKAKLNFSEWDQYTTSKQAKKASTICSVLTKEIMPPKSARESKPELIPTKEQIESICKWAESLKSN